MNAFNLNKMAKATGALDDATAILQQLRDAAERAGETEKAELFSQAIKSARKANEDLSVASDVEEPAEAQQAEETKAAEIAGNVADLRRQVALEMDPTRKARYQEQLRVAEALADERKDPKTHHDALPKKKLPAGVTYKR